MANNPLLDLGGSATWTSAAFTLLEQIHLPPTKEFYSTHTEEFKQSRKKPFQQIPDAVGQRLRPEITELMETENRKSEELTHLHIIC